MTDLHNIILTQVVSITDFVFTANVSDPSMN